MVPLADIQAEVPGFLEILGLREEPLGMFYTPVAPAEGFSPQSAILPDVDREAAGEVDWQATFANFACVIGLIWRARKLGKPAYFDQNRFGCLGAPLPGFFKTAAGVYHALCLHRHPQRPGRGVLPGVPGGHPPVLRDHRPPTGPGARLRLQSLSQFAPEENPEVVIFFARGEVIGGLNQLATFVTNDFEAVMSPFGAGCSNIVAWPLKYLEQGRLKAVLGGWDPSDRKFLKPDEITFAVPWEMFARMVTRYRESFLTSPPGPGPEKNRAEPQGLEGQIRRRQGGKKPPAPS